MPACAQRELNLEGVADGNPVQFRDTTANATFKDASEQAPGELIIDSGPGGKLAIEFEESLGKRGTSVARALVQVRALGAVVESCEGSKSRIALERGVVHLMLRELSPYPGCNLTRATELSGCFGLY